MGFTFKENCPDVRNTKVVDIFIGLEKMNLQVTVFDPHASVEDADLIYGLKVENKMPCSKFDAIIVAVGHKEFAQLTKSDFEKICNIKCVIFDVKNILADNIKSIGL